MKVTWFCITCKINSNSPPEAFGKCPWAPVSGEVVALPTEELQFTQRTVEMGAKFKGPPRFTRKDSPNLVSVKGGSFWIKAGFQMCSPILWIQGRQTCLGLCGLAPQSRRGPLWGTGKAHLFCSPVLQCFLFSVCSLLYEARGTIP